MSQAFHVFTIQPAWRKARYSVDCDQMPRIFSGQAFWRWFTFQIFLFDCPHKPVKCPRSYNFLASTLQTPEELLHTDVTPKCSPSLAGDRCHADVLLMAVSEWAGCSDFRGFFPFNEPKVIAHGRPCCQGSTFRTEDPWYHPLICP